MELRTPDGRLIATVAQDGRIVDTGGRLLGRFDGSVVRLSGGLLLGHMDSSGHWLDSHDRVELKVEGDRLVTCDGRLVARLRFAAEV